MKKTIRLVKCGECEIRMQASWLVGGSLLVMDSMMREEYRKNCTPFMNSHIAPNPSFDDKCPKCDYEFPKEGSFSACLVNHGDDTACIHCPECNTYISKSALWHKTTWEIKDLEIEEVEEEEPTEIDIKGWLSKDYEAHEFKVNGEIKDLE